MSYINSTRDVACYGWIGDKWEDLQLVLFADANKGEKPTFNSTSGAFLCLSGPNSFFPLAALSKKQTSIAHSTPEAEIVSVDTALKNLGVPSLSLWDHIMGHGSRKLEAILKEDNEAAIRVLSAGRNPTMRHMQRTQGISLSWIWERFERKEFELDKCPTREMSADIFTKPFTDKTTWTHARKLIGHYLPEELGLSAVKAKSVIAPVVRLNDGMTISPQHSRIIIEYCCGPES